MSKWFSHIERTEEVGLARRMYEFEYKRDEKGKA